LILIFLVILSLDAANETLNWSFFNFDFTTKDNIISAYGGLLSGILSFITIMFVVLDLVYQRRQATFQEEEKIEDKKSELKSALGVVQIYVDRLYEANLTQATTASEYSAKEFKDSTEMNRMSFHPNTYPSLILKLDNTLVYNAFLEFKPGKDWKKLYANLYGVADFYDKSTEEMMQKHKIHLDKKYEHSIRVSVILDDLIDSVSEARNEIITAYGGDNPQLLTDTAFQILNNFKEATVMITEARNEQMEDGVPSSENSTSISDFRVNIVSPLFDGIMTLYRQGNSLSSQLNNILSKAQIFLRQSEKLIKDSTDYASHIEYYTKEYLSAESVYQKKLEEINSELVKILM
tara:strand:+ start:301 stop:1347 length:1047 start_codon:yes stop_codon:yes gene_type:complete